MLFIVYLYFCFMSFYLITIFFFSRCKITQIILIVAPKSISTPFNPYHLKAHTSYIKHQTSHIIPL